MENRVQYIIDLVVQDKQLRKQMANVDWEKIIGSSGKGMSDAFAKETKDATDKIKSTFHGLNIDWNAILGSKYLGRLEQQMAKVLSSSKKQISAFATTGDMSGIQRTVEYVAELGNQLKLLGSSFDAAQLSRGMTSFMKVLTPLSAKIETLAKEPAKVEAAFDRLFNGVAVGANNTVKSSEKIFNIMTKIETATKRTGGSQASLDKLTQRYKELSDLKFPDLSKLNLDQLGDKMTDLEDRWDALETRFKGKKTSSTFQLERGKLLKEELAIYNAINNIEPTYSKEITGDIETKVQKIITAFENAISKLQKQIDSDSFAQAISKQLSDVKISLSLPDNAKSKLINEINNVIKSINQSPLETVKVDLSKTLDDYANLIEDKQKRAYGASEADDDVNTTALVNKTGKRLDRIIKVFDEKLNGKINENTGEVADGILQKTQKWRNNMLSQFKFKSGDFDFKFNDSLIDSLQSLFDDYFLKVNIDPNYLADQIKTVLDNGNNTISGGIANIDANSIAAAIATGLRSALFGDKIQIPQGSGPKNVDGNTLSTGKARSNTEYIAAEIEGTAKHLDLAEDYVKDVVAKLKAVAKYASKDSSGAKATKTRFNELGIDLSKVKTASDVGNDTEIVSIIEKALLQRDEFGNLKGSTIASELSKFKGSSSKTIPAFIDSMDEVFYMLQEDTQSIEDWTRKRHSKEILDSARGTAKAANALRGVRSTIRQESIPDLKSIENAISFMSAIGKNTDNLQVLKTAREALGTKTDDAAISEFRTAADNFYKSSTKTFWDLKEQAEETFRGTVYFQGKNGNKYGKYYDSYKQLASIKDDSIIVDVQVSSSLNNTTLGTVKSKYSNRTSQSEEKQLMRNASKPDYIIPREYESDILNKKLNYQGFKPQNVSSVPIDFDATIERQKKDIVQSESTITELHKNITSLEQKIKEKQSEVEHLKKTLDLIGSEPTYQVHTNDGYSKKFDILYSLNKNSKVTSESELPKDGYPTEISDAIKKKNTLNDKLAKLSEQAKLVEKLTIEEARTRLQRLSEGLVSDEEMALYQKFIDNPIDKDVLNKNVEVKGYSKEEINKLKKISPNEAKVLLQRGRAQRESMDLYSRFIQDPDSVRKDISSSIKQVTQESVSNQKNLDSYILAWAKSEEEKIPEAKAILERAAKNVLSKVTSTMRSLYEDIVTTEEQLNGNISDDERQVLIAHMQDSLELFSQAQKEYNSLISQNKITRKKPLSEDKFKKITSLQSQYQGSVRNELNSSITSTTSELGELIGQKSKLNQQEIEIATQQKHSESIIKRSEAEKEYNQLLEKSLMLQGSIKKMEEDGASESALKKKQKELDGVNVRLSEAKAKVEALGGFFGQNNDKEYSDNEKKSYALREIEKIDNDLITAKAQKRVVESRISKKDKEIADLDKWGLSAGIGASTLAKTKYNLTLEFMSGDYVRAKEDALREKAKTAIIESENESKKIFDAKVATAMEYLGWNPLDQVQVKKFLNTEHGQQLSNDFASEVDTNTTNIWKQYDEFRKDLLSKLEKEFQDSFDVDKGVLTATTKTQDETGNWIDETVEVSVREALKTRLEEEKRILESQQQPIQSNIDKLEADKAAAIEYGGISDKELLSGEVIEDQIEKEEYLAKLKEDRIVAQEKINSLEEANVDRSSDDYKSAKKDLSNIDAEIAKYEMRIKDRQNLVQNRYDESKEPKYTDEENELRFTNQIVSCNEKIESSLAKQKTLKEQIATATGDDKAKLERSLSLEEEKVSKWNGKKLKYETKLNRLQGSNDTYIAGGILPEGGIVGSIMSAINGISGDIQIDTTDLAKDSTLKAILEVLGGVPQTTDNGSGLRRRDKRTNEDAKNLYRTWNVKPQDLDFDTVKTKAIALKQVIDTLYDEGKSDTEEFINAQTELSKLLSAWRNKIGKSTNPELYGKTGKENWASYLTSGNTKIFDNLDNVELSSISQKDYLSRLKKIGVDTSNAKTEIKESEANLQIKDFDEFKLQVKSLKQAIELQEAGSEEQKKLQAELVQVLQAWAKNEASGFGGKLPNAKGWESYLISSGVFDSIDTSITPLTSRQLNKGSKTKNTTSKKTVEQRTDTPKKTESHTETVQPENRQATGGLLQLVGQLAKENTLLQVLNALQTLGTVEGGKPAPTAAGDLYNQFKALLLGSSIDDYERLAYMNSKEGLLSGNVIGNIANISEELINTLRAKYPNAQGFDTQIHTHGKSIDPYFSDEDYQHFTKDYESGIKKQVLLTKDNISVLDLTAVKSAEEVKGLMDELIKAGNSAEAIKKVFETNKSGAIFETAKFDSLNANSLFKMLGAKGINSNDTMTEINAIVSKLQTAREAMAQAINVGYLSKDDTNLAEFDKILNRTNEISESIKNGTTSYEAQKDELDKLTNSATRYSDIINSTIGKNKRAYVGVGEVNSVNKQRDKIIGTFGSEDEFNNSNIALVRQYDEAVKNLNATYKELTDNQRIQNENERQSLSQQASQVQALGKHLLSSISEAKKLKQLVDQSGTYKDKKGNFQSLGGSTEISIDNIKNLDTVMRNYVQNTLGQANIEHAKFDATNQRLTYSFRTSQKTVADMVVQYDDLTKSLYAYQKQERESLSGLSGVMQGFKSKLHSILQYTASITSIYSVFGELKRGIQYVREIDSALTELKKVTDETEATYDKFLNTAAKTADKVGSTIKEVVSSTADFARLGSILAKTNIRPIIQ